MDFKKSQKLLKKISKIIDVLAENDEQPSAIENDLLRSYTRELYEVIGADTQTQRPVQPSQSQQQNTIEISAEEVAAHTVQSNQTPTSRPITEAPLANVTPVHTPVRSVPSYQPSAGSGADDQLDSLFEDEGGTDLSDRIANRPLNDLSKGMGINEKIYTIQELFGGKKSEFDDAISTLNSFSSFEEAAAYLKQGVAKSFEWSSEAKTKKAAHFIKLVRRRYR